MSQVFSADAVGISAAVTVTSNTETTVLTGNFLSPPFQNAKAVIWATTVLTVGASVTSVAIRIRRNPNAENLQIQGAGSINVTAGNVVVLSIQGIDPLAGPGPAQYAVTLQQTGATGNGSATVASLAAMLISG